jgi:polynucleotide 5'-kinase involved in rRNA processing
MDAAGMQQMMMQMMVANQMLMQENARRDRERDERDREERRRRRFKLSTPAVVEPKNPHVNYPEVFDGSRADKLESFLTRCRQVFLLQPQVYHNKQL